MAQEGEKKPVPEHSDPFSFGEQLVRRLIKESAGKK